MKRPTRVVSFNGPVGSGVTDSQYVHLSGIAKNSVNGGMYCLCNEVIAAEIAHYLRLPIPPYTLLHAKAPSIPAKQSWWFASLDFNIAGLALPPITPQECVTRLPDMATGIVLFDALIANTDRHRKNIAFDASETPPLISIYDHSHALYGVVPDGGTFRLSQASADLGITGTGLLEGNRHCLLDWLSSDSHFDKWITRIESIPDFLINEICEESVTYGANQEEASAMRTFLCDRRSNFRNLIETHQAEFKGINQWSML